MNKKSVDQLLEDGLKSREEKLTPARLLEEKKLQVLEKKNAQKRQLWNNATQNLKGMITESSRFKSFLQLRPTSIFEYKDDDHNWLISIRMDHTSNALRIELNFISRNEGSYVSYSYGGDKMPHGDDYAFEHLSDIAKIPEVIWKKIKPTLKTLSSREKTISLILS